MRRDVPTLTPPWGSSRRSAKSIYPRIITQVRRGEQKVSKVFGLLTYFCALFQLCSPDKPTPQASLEHVVSKVSKVSKVLLPLWKILFLFTRALWDGLTSGVIAFHCLHTFTQKVDRVCIMEWLDERC